MNLREMSSQLHLSIGTVSICLTGDPVKSRIAESTVERVRTYAAEVGYVPSSLAKKNFHRGDSGVIGVLFRQDSAVTRNSPILSRAISRLTEAGREHLILGCCENRILQTLQAFKGMKIYQVILIGMIGQASFCVDRSLSGMKLYVLDYYFHQQELPEHFVYCGGIDRPLFYLSLGRLLQSRGYCPIMTDRNCNPEVLVDSGLMKQDDIFPVMDFSIDQLFEYGEALADAVLRRRPRVVLVHNDQIGIGLCHSLLRRGIGIPDEISVIGFNNSPFSSYAEVPLTSVELPVKENLEQVLNHILDGADLPRVNKQCPHIVSRCSTSDEMNHFFKDLTLE